MFYAKSRIPACLNDRSSHDLMILKDKFLREELVIFNGKTEYAGRTSSVIDHLSSIFRNTSALHLTISKGPVLSDTSFQRCFYGSNDK